MGCRRRFAPTTGRPCAAHAADPSGDACGRTTDRADGWTHDSPGRLQPALERHRRSWGIRGGRGFGDRPRRTAIRRTVAWPGAGSRNDRHANITTGALAGSAGSRLTLQEKKGGTQSVLGPQNRITVDRVGTHNACYPCRRSVLLPILAVAHSRFRVCHPIHRSCANDGVARLGSLRRVFRARRPLNRRDCASPRPIPDRSAPRSHAPGCCLAFPQVAELTA
jgi:hypothetical protein